MTDRDAQDETAHVPWHNRTSTLLGASVAGLVAIIVLIASVFYLADGFGEPEQAPIDYVGPISSPTTTRSTGPTTTATITTATTRPPVTTDIDPGETSSSSETPEASTRNPETTTSRNPNYRPPRTRDENAFEEEATRGEPSSDTP
ncbi:MAG: hypothetical protein AB7G47_01440 [Mycolicibacterium sp.]|uniref:hypothetical protein n=1 Tax=Mycolicibacterium sp. TaxID=2320850 RepID=UPI003D123161